MPSPGISVIFSDTYRKSKKFRRYLEKVRRIRVARTAPLKKSSGAASPFPDYFPGLD
jgi:hypothetical protein